MKKAFTAVELVFVIAVVGILSSVLIPKLAANRESARIATIVQNAQILQNDIIQGAIASGTLPPASNKHKEWFLKHSNVLDVYKNQDKKYIKYNSKTCSIDIMDVDNNQTCVMFKLGGCANNFNVIHNKKANTPFCKKIKSMAKEKEIQLAGTTVTY